LRFGRQIVTRGIRNIVTWGSRTTDDLLIGVEVGAGTGVGRVIRVGGWGNPLEPVGDEGLIISGVIDGAAMMDMPVGKGTGGDGLSLCGDRMVIGTYFLGYNVQEVVSFYRDGDRVGAIGVKAFIREKGTTISWIRRINRAKGDLIPSLIQCPHLHSD